MEEWIRVGLLMKEVDQKLLEVTRMLGGKVGASTIDLLYRLRKVQVGRVRGHLEDVMFKQHPQTWSAEDIGAWLGQSVLTRPSFPQPVVLAGVAGAQKRWVSDEVLKWVRENLRTLPKSPKGDERGAA